MPFIKANQWQSPQASEQKKNPLSSNFSTVVLKRVASSIIISDFLISFIISSFKLIIRLIVVGRDTLPTEIS